MPRSAHHFRNGFTLLEISLAVLIALVVMGVAIPSLTAALEGSKTSKVFRDFDAMVQEAHQRSESERRNYVMAWGGDGVVRMRPEVPANREEGEGIRRWKIAKDDALALHLPAALTENGMEPDAVWTFWANGVCEPARVDYRGAAGAWVATYPPFTIQAEVRYE